MEHQDHIMFKGSYLCNENLETVDEADLDITRALPQRKGKRTSVVGSALVVHLTHHTQRNAGLLDRVNLVEQYAGLTKHGCHGYKCDWHPARLMTCMPLTRLRTCAVDTFARQAACCCSVRTLPFLLTHMYWIFCRDVLTTQVLAYCLHWLRMMKFSAKYRCSADMKKQHIARHDAMMRLLVKEFTKGAKGSHYLIADVGTCGHTNLCCQIPTFNTRHKTLHLAAPTLFAGSAMRGRRWGQTWW